MSHCINHLIFAPARGRAEAAINHSILKHRMRVDVMRTNWDLMEDESFADAMFAGAKTLVQLHANQSVEIMVQQRFMERALKFFRRLEEFGRSLDTILHPSFRTITIADRPPSRVIVACSDGRQVFNESRFCLVEDHAGSVDMIVLPGGPLFLHHYPHVGAMLRKHYEEFNVPWSGVYHYECGMRLLLNKEGFADAEAERAHCCAHEQFEGYERFLWQPGLNKPGVPYEPLIVSP
ncbi:MAG: hypothetical protein HYV32_04495 [Candidatus Kerfeldbacteria bacterium]|nr:hypothetical protein [Candidatus Kerfeldbacteria bacterium]